MIKTYAIDDFAGVQTAALGIGVQFVEIRHAKRQVGVGEQLDGLRFGGADHKLRNADAAIGVGAGLFLRVGAMRQQVHEFVCRLDGCLVVLRSTHHDARRVEIVGQRVPLAEKFREKRMWSSCRVSRSCCV